MAWAFFSLPDQMRTFFFCANQTGRAVPGIVVSPALFPASFFPVSLSSPIVTRGTLGLLDVFPAQRDTEVCDFQTYSSIYPMLFQCWPSVCDAGPTLKQHWVNAPCFLGYSKVYDIRGGLFFRGPVAALSLPDCRVKYAFFYKSFFRAVCPPPPLNHRCRGSEAKCWKNLRYGSDFISTIVDSQISCQSFHLRIYCCAKASSGNRFLFKKGKGVV